MQIRYRFLIGLFVLLSACSSPDIMDAPEEPAPMPPPADIVLEQAKERAKARAQAQLDQELDALRAYPIAYETPATAIAGTAFDVTLAIDGTGDNSAIEGLPGKDVIVESEALLSRDVEASLSGAAFDIRMTTSPRQTLSPVRESVWRWSVTPLSAGEHNLFLEIHALIGPDQTMLLESYADLISVSVAETPKDSNRAEDLRTYISILGGIISILLGLIALNAHYKNRKKKTSKDDED